MKSESLPGSWSCPGCWAAWPCLRLPPGVLLASLPGFPTRPLRFWLDTVVLQIGRTMLVSRPSSKSLAWGLGAQWGRSHDLCAEWAEHCV